MRYLCALILSLVTQVCLAQEWEDRQIFGSSNSAQTVRILSSTDTAIFAPIIENFIGQNASISIEYFVTGTADLDRKFREAPEDFDIVISSAMDLQFKLANDGYALRLENLQHPEWAQWRESLFAFTAEPAAIVINRDAFENYPLPKTRQELIVALRERPDVFQGRVGTYDVRESGLGYLFATQDARASDTFWRLMEVMGGLNVRLYCCSGSMIDDLADGSLAVAYNVLGSYAGARIDDTDALEVVLPSDFPTTMMRTALVSSETEQAAIARTFVQHLIARNEADSDNLPLPVLSTIGPSIEPTTIPLEPALMTFLDDLKRRQFLTEWEAAVIQK